jgi:hypothetical protein
MLQSLLQCAHDESRQNLFMSEDMLDNRMDLGFASIG